MAAELEPYRQYKDSGVEWLGEVPAHWDVRCLGRIGRFFKGGGGTKEDERESGVPCVRYGDLYTHHRFFITASRACVSPELAATAYTPLRYGDVLFAGSGETIDEIGKSAVNLIRGSACCGGDVIIFRPSIRVAPRFLGYASDCPLSARQKASMGRGFTVMHIYSRDLKYMVVALPPLLEQAAIVRFLDHADRSIRRYIRAKQKLIALLEEQKQALIHQAVTGKIDVRTGQPYPAYKPSGADWLGEVPAHWYLSPLKRVSRRWQNGATPPTSKIVFYENGNVPWYGPNSCGTKEEVAQPVRHLSNAAFLHGGARLVRGPALLIVVIGATAGRMTLMPNDGSTNQQITAFEIPRERVSPRFMLRQARGAESWLRSTAASSTIPILDSGVLGRLLCAVPPLVEQEMINRAVDCSVARIDELVERRLEAISLFREYRARLIADVVTGNLDVRNAAAELPGDDISDRAGELAEESNVDNEVTV